MTRLSISDEIEAARLVAIAAHSGQKDRVHGRPYIEHVHRVARAVPASEQPAAWLHDVLEDSAVTLRDLERSDLFSAETLEAVELLTRDPLATYEDYIKGIARSSSEIAVGVKLADLHDHLTPDCPVSLVPRYTAARDALMATGLF